MVDEEKGRRFRFDEKTSDIACLIELPVESERGRALKSLLRRFLRLLDELSLRLARRPGS